MSLTVCKLLSERRRAILQPSALACVNLLVDLRERRHDLTGNWHRVFTRPRRAPIYPLIADVDPDQLRRGHRIPALVEDRTDWNGRNMNPKKTVWPWVLKSPLADHRVRASVLSNGWTLRRRLENELHDPGDPVTHRGQEPQVSVAKNPES